MNKLPKYPKGAPAFYSEYITQTLTDGWCYGMITEIIFDEYEYSSGDGFVVAPNSDYAGLVWSTDIDFLFERIEGPRNENMFGVFEVRFPQIVRSAEDLVYCFRTVLPYIQNAYKFD